jgi:FlaA1/EpsC-like NDP-sugar epimerase
MLQISNLLILRLQAKVRRLYSRYSIPRGLVFALDNLAVFLVFIFAYLLRFNFELSGFEMAHALHQAILVLAIYMIASLLIRSYAGVIRYTTIEDIIKVFLSATWSFAVLLLITLLSRWIYRDENLVIPLSILIIHYISITLLLIFVRINIKLLYHMVTSTLREKKNVLVFGAGAMGIIVKRVIQSDEQCKYRIAAFLDDNKNLHGKHLDGIPVYNPNILTQSFVSKHQFDGLIFAIRHMPAQKKSQVLANALNLGLEVLEPPSVDTWLNGDFKIRDLKKVPLEALLGRDPIRLSMRKIELDLKGKVILVTGAAGSIGSEIVRQLTRFSVGNLILVDQAETPMFILENDLKKDFGHCQMQFILSDITNRERMELLFRYYHPDIVFHAAAYKHVPLMEENPHEAIRVNVGGTRLLSGLAMKYSVKKFVMISTDKAVNPTNVMGASKRMCEMIVQHRAYEQTNSTKFIITRFGNVLGSNGSVIPIFRKQIEVGGPVTVTHPDMTRYFMTIPEACQLVLEAGCMAKGGEIFVFDMGKPVRISELATQMIKFSGLVPEKDIKIVFTGLRPGEKLYEELFTDWEITCPTHHPKIRIAKIEKVRRVDTMSRMEHLLNILYSLSRDELVELLSDFVPEYSTANGNFTRSLKTRSRSAVAHEK